MSSALRAMRLADAADMTRRAAKFRSPQARSFDRVQDLVEKHLTGDLGELSQPEVNEAVMQLGLPVTREYPDLLFALATGVGKRRLMGALAAYLFAARQTRNILILAPRQAILKKLEREVMAVGADDYLFLDPRMVPNPNVCTRDNIDSFSPDPRNLNVFLLSPQTLTGRNRRIAKRRAFSSAPSLLEYLAAAPDLVVLADEAHHIGNEGAKWRDGINDVEPKLYLGFTATPEPGAPIAHTYSLGECLRDGKYTKGVDIFTKKRDELIDDDAWEKLTIEYAIRRLAAKERAFAERRATDGSWPDEPPVLLLTCSDTEHADAIGELLLNRFGFHEDEVLVTHSSRTVSEDEVERLIELDRPGNPVRAVVQVMQLTEGWDVRRVYVMAPLRAMGTLQYALQNLGRGLRLPENERVDQAELDTLDVVLFGRETAAQIIDQARSEFGDSESGSSPIEVTEAGDDEDDEAPPDRERVVQKADKRIEWVWPQVRRIPTPVDLDFDPDLPQNAIEDIVTTVSIGQGDQIGGSGADEAPSYELPLLKRVVVARVCNQAAFLDEINDREALEALVDGLLEKMGFEHSEADPVVYVSPARLAAYLADLIERRRNSAAVTYKPAGRDEILVLDEVPALVPAGLDSPIDHRIVE